MAYPEEFLRGISAPNHIVDGLPTIEIFPFPQARPVQRPDDCIEESINWHDDEQSMDELFDRRKEDDTPKFRVGLAVFDRHEIDKLCNAPHAKDRLFYERQALQGNTYHGNLLLKKDLPQSIKHLIRAGIVLSFKELVSPDDHALKSKRTRDSILHQAWDFLIRFLSSVGFLGTYTRGFLLRVWAKMKSP